MRSHATHVVGLGEVVELPRFERSSFRNLREPQFIHNAKYVINTSEFDLYRKTDVDDSLYTSDAYLNFASLSENIRLGGVDANSPHVASIGSGASKVSVYSVFANSVTNAPVVRAASSGISIVPLDVGSVSALPTEIAWSVVSNGSKFFAYPFSTTAGGICKTSTDGITWTQETLAGDFPSSFSSASTWRWFYNIPQSGYGIIPSAAKTHDVFSIGSNLFLLDGTTIRRSTNGINWTNITTTVFGNATHESRGYYIGVNGTSGFVANVHGIKYTVDSGMTWVTPTDTITVPTSFGFTANKNSQAKYIAKNATPNNLYYVSTNTGASWSRIEPGVNSTHVMYRNSTIVVLFAESMTCRVSTNNGGSFSNVSLPTTFVYPIKTAMDSSNWFYIIDAEGGVFRSSDGLSWSLACRYNIDTTSLSIAKSLDANTEVLCSLDDNTIQPYVCIYNGGANTVAARFGELSSSMIFPNINGNTDALICNANTLYAAKTTIAGIKTPPYMRFSASPVTPTRDGMYPYIRIG